MRKRFQTIALTLFAILAVCLLLSLDSVIQFLQVKQETVRGRDNPYYYLAATVKPRQDALVGRYVLTRQELTLEGLDFLQGKPATIELSANGSFAIINFPLWEQDGASRYNFKCSKLISSNGYWRIIEAGTNKGKTLWGIELRTDSGVLLSPLAKVAIVTNNDFPHGFFFDFGTEERIMVMLYERARAK